MNPLERRNIILASYEFCTNFANRYSVDQGRFIENKCSSFFNFRSENNNA